MSNDYGKVAEALSKGSAPAMLCATCQWDRNCINPPEMTSSDVRQMYGEAREQDEEAARASKQAGQPAFPVASLLTLMTMAGRDTSALICPVLALRLRSSGGKAIAEAVRGQMQAWDDDQA